MTPRTVLIVDIENASVGAGLARYAPKESPKLFADTRITFPIRHTLSLTALAGEVERSLHQALTHMSAVAARLRIAGEKEAKAAKISTLGEIAEAVVFLAPPWSTLENKKRGLEWDFDSMLNTAIKKEIQAIFGDIPVSVRAFGAAAAHSAGLLFPQQKDFLLCAITGEVSEILAVRPLTGPVRQGASTIVGRGTMPSGRNTLTRTLMTHGGMSHEEAHSALRLAHIHPELQTEHMVGPLRTAAHEFSRHFSDVATPLTEGGLVSGVVVVSHEPTAGWFARTLSHTQLLSDLFPLGGTARALNSHHLKPYVVVHSPNPDVPLMLETLFLVYL